MIFDMNVSSVPFFEDVKTISLCNDLKSKPSAQRFFSFFFLLHKQNLKIR